MGGGGGGGNDFLGLPTFTTAILVEGPKMGDALFQIILIPNTQIYCMLLKITYLPGEVVGGGEVERDFC